ncbi:hypothetical protein Kpol_1013p30 [Vanderwaltozyma polyspora DSM 70294]|uniref:DNA repair protein RAD7 n=1 Tax=Vanderwaltozyma polyspora (strain ATCC 22028 / DSM 70294 / BCRC 21397 / CBS 2163 / NBRC 10782 / NRRL Y-8283 / UCD 57-17) TaxID=436907 RepID=A7TH78_VANPO|nr:uncharacterized protein Kpol_1013p30 [Vanderwaltozyma polyspora DSM 70294]EDO18359.1 hypothetical protein Kpol_1013p30 [Vanderwaltozyma polyspora DSM 70294]
MYRSRNRGRANGSEGIKGPNSALTQFLQEEGISAELIRQRWLENQVTGETDISTKESSSSVDVKTLDKSIKEEEEEEDRNSVNLESESSDDEGSSSRRRKFKTIDSDEEEYVEDSGTEVSITNNIQRKSSRLNPDHPSAKKKTKEILQSRKRKRNRAADLLNRKTVRLPRLQSLCIHKISENIKRLQSEDSGTTRGDLSSTIYSKLRKVLGGISTNNLENLSKALSKNRALDDNTLQLFLKTELTSLTFHDCSKLSFEGYKSLAIFSPHLKELSLQMCGQLNNESLLYIAEKLPHLVSLKLDGPFLINEATWEEFFGIMKGRLKEFHISNTHRFNDSSLSCLLRNCGSSLESLGLSRLDCVFNYSLIPQYLNNPAFHTISIQYPYNEEDVNDEVVINILGQVGANIRTLTLDGCQGLTDSMLINGMSAFLSDNKNLENISLSELDQITSDGLIYFLSQTPMPNLKSCSFAKCLNIGNPAVAELFANEAKDSLIYLNLNSMKELTSELFEIMFCPNLEHLDVSFVRCINDESVKIIGNQNPKLKIMDIFGDNLVTSNATIRDGLTVIGRQSDSI